MNKKAMQTTGIIASFIIMGLIIIFFVFFMNRQFPSVNNVVTTYIEAVGNDFDSDGIKDITDKSPCVAGEELIIATNGKSYYYFADRVEYPANSKQFRCNAVDFPDLDSSANLEERTEDSTRKIVCVLPNKVCAKWLIEEYEAKDVEYLPG